MFTAVWMIYAADRLLDSRDINAPGLEARHHFHQQYRNRFLFIILLATPALVLLLHYTNARALHLYTLLAALLGAWMLLIHARPTPAHRLPKELAVGIFFPAAVFIPTIARIPQRQLELLPAAALFAAVCTLNCLCIYAWEHPTPQPHAHWTTRWATRHLTQLSVSILLIAVLTAPILHQPAIACALSTALLLLLHTQRHRVSPLTLRATADMTLLTPVLFFL